MFSLEIKTVQSKIVWQLYARQSVGFQVGCHMTNESNNSPMKL
jgi:hypothetical protein